MTKPDFIIIGAMKSATSSLHEQLAMQAGIFMSTPKEPNFFSDDDQYSRGLDWYRGLFSSAGAHDLCGESSTHYTKLPHHPKSLERMQEYLPAVKLIYVLRHPIDRLVSHYIHQWSMRVISCDINEALESFDELIAYSRYAMQLEPYIQAYGKDNILVTCNEAIRAQPQKELERVTSFIGYSKTPTWQETVGDQNVSSQRIRPFPGYGLIVESRLMTFLRQNLIPQSFRDRIKSGLTMQERPVLSDENITKLTAIFNDDLATFGSWFGLTLDCENYKEVAKTAVFEFK